LFPSNAWIPKVSVIGAALLRNIVDFLAEVGQYVGQIDSASAAVRPPIAWEWAALGSKIGYNRP
jgi:hypothetical protein